MVPWLPTLFNTFVNPAATGPTSGAIAVGRVSTPVSAECRRQCRPKERARPVSPAPFLGRRYGTRQSQGGPKKKLLYFP